MTEFTGWGRTNKIDFGDYVEFPYGYSKEMHIWKVVGAFESNTFMKPPYTFHSKEEIQNDGIVRVLNIIHCGIDETKVIRVRESDCIKIENAFTKENQRLREALEDIATRDYTLYEMLNIADKALEGNP